MELARQREEAAVRRDEERRKRMEDHIRVVHYGLEMDRVNRFVESEQIRHHQDLITGRPYTQYVPYVDYSTIRDQPQEVIDQTPWPQGISSSYLPYQPPQQPTKGSSSSADPLSTYHG